MPVSRTPPMKTQRTSAENKERASIAASRRSDRSLEARIQSAEKASEIHKQRTGRALKVTREDVENEEMYEEEDDGVRRFMSQLPYLGYIQGAPGSADNMVERFHTHMAANIGLRDNLQAMIEASQAMDQNPGAYNLQGFPQPFPPNQNMYSNNVFPIHPQVMVPLVPSVSQSIPRPMPIATTQSQVQSSRPINVKTQSYRTSPYPQQQQQRMQAMHQRSASIANIGSPDGTSDIAASQTRRLSMPVTPAGTSVKESTHSTSSPDTSNGQRPSFPPGSFNARFNRVTPVNDLTSVTAQSFAGPALGVNPSTNPQLPNATSADTFPLTTALPANAQMVFGNALPADSYLMAGSDRLPLYNGPGGFQSFQNATSIGKGGQMYPSFEGLNSTLAPSAQSTQEQENHTEEPTILMYDDFSKFTQLDDDPWSSFMNSEAIA